MTVVFSGEVHPAAELFPLMGDDDLAALAADIKANGLRQPIVLDGEGRMLDGRNRHAACKIAKVAPEFVSVNGDDPVALVVSLNVKRRNLSQAQRAIAAAEVASSGANFGPGKKAERLAELFGVSSGYIKQATALDTELAAEVKAGVRGLSEAYEEHQARKRAITMRESSLDALRQKHPDLADLVTTEQLGLTEALAAGKTRDAEIEEERRSRTRDLITLATSAPAHHAERYAEMYDPKQDPSGAVSAAALRSAAQFATAVADALEGDRK